MIAFSHKPVLLEECMQGLRLKEGGVWFDGTVGGEVTPTKSSKGQARADN